MIDHDDVPIFIVDDDENILDIVKKALASEKFNNIDCAKSGKELLEKLKLPASGKEGTRTVQQSSVYIFVLDIMLPDINGLDLCTQIKSIFPETIVILISGFDIEDLHKRIIESDADDFLTKPFNPLELVSRINLLIHKHNKNILKASLLHNANSEQTRNQIPHIGDRIDDFNIIDCLGWGKSSVIYKVIEKDGSSVYAIKLLTRYALDFEEIVERFRHEIRIMSDLEHPNVIKFYKMGDYNGCPYILMDYIHGINLEEFIVTRGLPDLKVIFKAALQTASALEEVHKNGIVHRDIKLKNLMLELQSGRLYLTDFGIARGMNEGTNITHDGFIVGTPIYMAPEMFRGESSTFSSDIYSYGVTMYQFITGAPPFIGKSNSDLYQKHMEEIPRKISDTRLGFPPEFEKLIIEQCMAKLPENRPASMTEIIKSLEDINKTYNFIAR
ncbi:MAG: hypothetical protein A2017_09890 [Lentisphaerae bacterium GWF2_44_16]|nr:MAG: hypothetical protein A2017_09890 [Lentisphaerae bacterium GWF2_44_16]